MGADNERVPAKAADKVAFGNVFRGMLSATGVSQAEAARIIGASAAAVSRWCDGERETPIAALARFAPMIPGARAALHVEALAAWLGWQGVWLPRDPTVEAGNAFDIASRASNLGAEIVATILEAMRDGRIDGAEPALLRSLARRLRDLAARVEALAAEGDRS